MLGKWLGSHGIPPPGERSSIEMDWDASDTPKPGAIRPACCGYQSEVLGVLREGVMNRTWVHANTSTD